MLKKLMIAAAVGVGVAVFGTTQAAEEKGNPSRLEQPATLQNTPERILQHMGYMLSYNRTTNCPNWVAWELTREEAEGNGRRANTFLPDPDLPISQQVTTNDYKNSGYDRGHMCPAADMKWSPRAMTECFYMSNMCPQNPALNSGPWSSLEEACRRWAKKEGKVYIVCGPVFTSKRPKTIGQDLKIRVPNGFFKVVLSTKKGSEKAIGFYYANRGGKQRMHETATSVDEIEKMTGMNFFHQLDDALEKRVEANFSLKAWQ